MLERLDNGPEVQMWCGRSWEGLAEPRREMFAHAVALKGAGQADSQRVVSAFLEFFDTTGAQLMRDEEEWVLRSVRPAPAVVTQALADHVEISSLIEALVSETGAGCIDARVVNALGELIEGHLLMEEEQVGPLVTAQPHLTLPR